MSRQRDAMRATQDFGLTAPRPGPSAATISPHASRPRRDAAISAIKAAEAKHVRSLRAAWKRSTSPTIPLEGDNPVDDAR